MRQQPLCLLQQAQNKNLFFPIEHEELAMATPVVLVFVAMVSCMTNSFLMSNWL